MGGSRKVDPWGDAHRCGAGRVLFLVGMSTQPESRYGRRFAHPTPRRPCERHIRGSSRWRTRRSPIYASGMTLGKNSESSRRCSFRRIAGARRGTESLGEMIDFDAKRLVPTKKPRGITTRPDRKRGAAPQRHNRTRTRPDRSLNETLRTTRQIAARFGPRRRRTIRGRSNREPVRHEIGPQPG